MARQRVSSLRQDLKNNRMETVSPSPLDPLSSIHRERRKDLELALIGQNYEDDEEQSRDFSARALNRICWVIGWILAPVSLWYLLKILWLFGVFHAKCPTTQGRICNFPYGKCQSTGFCECLHGAFSGEACEITLCTGYNAKEGTM